MDEDLAKLIEQSKARVAAMTPEEYAAMIEAQAASYARSLLACEHGIVDFEQCDDCRSQALEANNG